VDRHPYRAIAAAVLVVCSCLVVQAQQKADVVYLANGDRITGEISRLERGRLQFDTDDAGTLYLEWDKLASVVTKRLVEVLTADGRTFLGSLTSATDRWIAVTGTEGTVTLLMSQVTLMTPIGGSFWRKLDGSFDAGFNYTKSSGVAQLNVQSDTIFRRPGFQAELTASLTQTEKSDGTGSDDRAAVDLSYVRYPWPRWFLTAAGRVETNKSMGLELRSQVGGTLGPRLVNSNRAQLGIGAGLVFNEEQGVDVETTQNLEALLLFRTSFFTYDRPRTNLDVSVRYYPSLSNLGRQRVQLDAGLKREIWKDLFLAVSVFDTFDSRPPNPEAERNDVGVITSVGWSY
jgi:hypothetical protein